MATAASRTALSQKCELSVQREASKSLFEKINAYRRTKRLVPLTWDDTLFTYCVLHNLDMHGSKLMSSDFKFGTGYNENTGHAYVKPSHAAEILDLWRSRSQEKNNLLFEGVKYSAIALLGNQDECFATQIFTIDRPRRSEKIPSMKTKPCGSCLTGRSKAFSRTKSSGSRMATTYAVSRLSNGRSNVGLSRPSSRYSARSGARSSRARSMARSNGTSKRSGSIPVINLAQQKDSYAPRVSTILRKLGQPLSSGLKSQPQSRGNTSSRYRSRSQGHSRARSSPCGPGGCGFGPGISRASSYGASARTSRGFSGNTAGPSARGYSCGGSAGPSSRGYRCGPPVCGPSGKKSTRGCCSDNSDSDCGSMRCGTYKSGMSTRCGSTFCDSCSSSC